ncbi:MAG: T9SS type A sorting domain-containing protein [Ignavibacteriaceae bacterium]
MEKLNFSLSLLLFFYGLLFLQSTPYAKEDSLYVKFAGDTVQVWNTDITANCVSTFLLDIMQTGIDSFTVTEIDTTGPLANCMCKYDLFASLTGLNAGQHIISIYRQELKKYFYPVDTTIFIGELSFTLHDSSAAENSFSFKQSECKSYFWEQTFNARYFYAEADSVAKAIFNDAKIQTIYSGDVFLDGKSTVWNYRFSRYDQNNNRPEYLYFHNNTSGIVFDSISLYTVCCVTNITDEWFDSDSAIAYADYHGGKAFRDDNPDYIIKASLVQALVPNAYPFWSVTYLSKTDSSEKFSLFFDGRINASIQISFTPAVDTLYLQGGCCQPGFSFHSEQLGTTENISLLPDLNTTVMTKSTSGNYKKVDTSYFLIKHPTGNYEYEIWYYRISNSRTGPVLIPMDSMFHAPFDFAVKLIVKLNGIHVDSLSKFFIPQYGLDVKSADIPPGKYYLYQNCPNPFNPSTLIKYELPEETSVNIIIYNIIGEKVAELVNSFRKAGRHEIIWDPQNIASGIYFCRMRAGNFVSTKKLVFFK